MKRSSINSSVLPQGWLYRKSWAPPACKASFELIWNPQRAVQSRSRRTAATPTARFLGVFPHHGRQPREDEEPGIAPGSGKTTGINSGGEACFSLLLWVPHKIKIVAQTLIFPGSQIIQDCYICDSMGRIPIKPTPKRFQNPVKGSFSKVTG